MTYSNMDVNRDGIVERAEWRGNDNVFQVSDWNGDDVLSGGEGNDLVTAGAGNDSLEGGSGADLLFDETGRDTVRGGAGDDRVVAALDEDRDTYDGGEGAADALDLTATEAGVSVDLAAGSAEGEEIGDNAVTGFEIVEGGAGNDSLAGSEGGETLSGAGGRLPHRIRQARRGFPVTPPPRGC